MHANALLAAHILVYLHSILGVGVHRLHKPTRPEGQQAGAGRGANGGFTTTVQQAGHREGGGSHHHSTERTVVKLSWPKGPKRPAHDDLAASEV